MPIIGRISEENPTYINIIPYRVRIGKLQILLLNIIMGVLIHLIVWSVMDGKNLNIILCYLELSSVLTKTAIRMIAPSFITIKREDK